MVSQPTLLREEHEDDGDGGGDGGLPVRHPVILLGGLPYLQEICMS